MRQGWDHAAWTAWMAEDRIIDRYRSMIVDAEGHWWWTGAVMRSGHGRFWVAAIDRRDAVVAAHRFGYGLAFGVEALMATAVVMHTCDEPLCQRPDHLMAGTQAENHQAWAVRHHDFGSPLRDSRTRYDRAVAIRSAARTGASIRQAIDAGTPDTDRRSPTLPGLESVSHLLHVSPPST